MPSTPRRSRSAPRARSPCPTPAPAPPAPTRPPAATSAFSAACLLAMPHLRPGHAGPHESTRRAIATGWRAVRERPWVLRFLAVLLAYHLVVLPCVFVLGPLIAQRELDGATSWGVIQGAWALGAIGGGVLAMRARVAEPMRAVGLAFAVGSLQALVIALGHTTAGIAAFLALAGIATSYGWTMWESTVQQRVPAHVLSRVISFDFTVSVGSLPLGTALIGPVAEGAGLRPTMIVASAIGATLALTYALSASARSRDRPAASR